MRPWAGNSDRTTSSLACLSTCSGLGSCGADARDQETQTQRSAASTVRMTGLWREGDMGHSFDGNVTAAKIHRSSGSTGGPAKCYSRRQWPGRSGLPDPAAVFLLDPPAGRRGGDPVLGEDLLDLLDLTGLDSHGLGHFAVELHPDVVIVLDQLPQGRLGLEVETGFIPDLDQALVGQSDLAGVEGRHQR